MASGNDNHKTSETVFRNFRLFSKYDKILISKPTGPVRNVIWLNYIPTFSSDWKNQSVCYRQQFKPHLVIPTYLNEHHLHVIYLCFKHLPGSTRGLYESILPKKMGASTKATLESKVTKWRWLEAVAASKASRIDSPAYRLSLWRWSFTSTAGFRGSWGKLEIHEGSSQKSAPLLRKKTIFWGDIKSTHYENTVGIFFIFNCFQYLIPQFDNYMSQQCGNVFCVFLGRGHLKYNQKSCWQSRWQFLVIEPVS